MEVRPGRAPLSTAILSAQPSSPATPTATLNVPNVGTYVVQLQVSDGTLPDTDQRVITVSEKQDDYAREVAFQKITNRVAGTRMAAEKLGIGNRVAV